MDTINSISPITETKEEKNPKEKTSGGNIPEKISDNEQFPGIPKVETISDTSANSNQNVSTISTSPIKSAKTNVVDDTNNPTPLHSVPKNAEPQTVALDKEEEEFIMDVEAAHGTK